MNYQITINAPEGKIPVYNESTQRIDFVDSWEKKDHPMLMTCPNI